MSVAADTLVAREPVLRKAAPTGWVLAVSVDASHNFSKPNVGSIELIAGLGIQGDAHLGVAVQHRVRVREDPTRPNLRQVHLIHAELLDELNSIGFCLEPGAIGENITTRGLDLLALPKGSRLHIGKTAVVEVTGLRNPCKQIEAFRPGLLAALIGRDAQGDPFLKSGIMGIILSSGPVQEGDSISVELPPEPHEKLKKV